jgi:hypothetical protein
MTSANRSNHRCPPRDQAGFTIVAVLILVGLMAALATTYSRHVIVYAQASEVSEATLEARELIDSQIEFIIQSQRVGMAVESSRVLDAITGGWVGHGEHLEADETAMTVGSMAASGSTTEDRSSVLTSVMSPNGMGATHLIETGRVPILIATHPDTLPVIADDVRIDVMNDSSVPKIYYTSSTLVQDTELTGLIIVSPAAVLTLDNVIVRGAIVSEGAADGSELGDYSAFLAPQLVIQGNARILSDSFLGDLAVLMPDGSITTSGATARLQIEGDVIAHTAQLDCPGAVVGNIATVDALVVGSDMQRVGFGREPQDWSAVLDHHDAWETEFVAFLPRNVTLTDLAAITDFELPAR